MTNNNTYTSRDFYLSAYLIATGNELAQYRKDAGNLTTFIFHNSHELQQSVRKFYALEAVIDPVVYGDALRSLKSIIHANTKPNHIYVEQLTTRQ
jgi:hypothetical protein